MLRNFKVVAERRASSFSMEKQYAEYRISNKEYWMRKYFYFTIRYSLFCGSMFMYRNFKQIVPPPRWGRLDGGEGKSSSPSPCPSHQGRGIFSRRRPNAMYRNFKVCIMATKQPPESPFSKGDLRKSPLIKGARGLCFLLTLLCI